MELVRDQATAEKSKPLERLRYIGVLAILHFTTPIISHSIRIPYLCFFSLKLLFFSCNSSDHHHYHSSLFASTTSSKIHFKKKEPTARKENGKLNKHRTPNRTTHDSFKYQNEQYFNSKQNE